MLVEFKSRFGSVVGLDPQEIAHYTLRVANMGLDAAFSVTLRGGDSLGWEYETDEEARAVYEAIRKHLEVISA